jgi:hypothetical protein
LALHKYFIVREAEKRVEIGCDVGNDSGCRVQEVEQKERRYEAHRKRMGTRYSHRPEEC